MSQDLRYINMYEYNPYPNYRYPTSDKELQAINHLQLQQAICNRDSVRVVELIKNHSIDLESPFNAISEENDLNKNSDQNNESEITNTPTSKRQPTPFEYALSLEHYDLLLYLASNAKQLNYVFQSVRDGHIGLDANQNNILHLAVLHYKHAFIEEIVKQLGDPIHNQFLQNLLTAKNNDGLTPWHLACQIGSQSVYLIENAFPAIQGKSILELRDAKNRLGYDLAVENEHFELLPILSCYYQHTYFNYKRQVIALKDSITEVVAPVVSYFYGSKPN